MSCARQQRGGTSLAQRMRSSTGNSGESSVLRAVRLAAYLGVPPLVMRSFPFILHLHPGRHINISVTQPDIVEQQLSYGSVGKGQGSLSRRQARQQSTLQLAQAEVLRIVNERRDHIPPLTSALITFPFEIMSEG